MSFFLSILFQILALSIVVRGETYHPDLKCGPENTEKRYLSFGDKSSAGMGNVLLFWPAAWAFAQITGREIVLTENTHPAHICETQPNCKYRIIHNIPRNDTYFWDAFKHRAFVRANEMFQFAGNTKPLNDKLIYASGFQDKSNWYTINRNTSMCIADLTNCTIWDSNCVTRVALSSFFPMPFSPDLLDHSALSGDEGRITAAFDSKTSISDYFGENSNNSRRFDLAIHLRIQFHLFENHTDPNSPEFMLMEKEYLESNLTRNVVDKTLAWIRKEVDVGSSIYIAADNEVVKRHLATRIEDMGRGISVTSSHTSGIKHSSHIKEADANIFYAIFDWFALATSKRILAYRPVKPQLCQRFASSFSLSAQRFGRAKGGVILCDPSETDLRKVWKKFPP
jgi:hypothetical protein